MKIMNRSLKENDLKEYVSSLIKKASEKLEYLQNKPIILNVPANRDHGDLSSNIAMLSAKQAGKPPREVAKDIINELQIDSGKITKVEIAGPGFINFFVDNSFASQIITEILNEADNFGRTNKYAGKRANVEFVSANPTGPLTVGHGRNAVIGDTIANMLEWLGYDVEREYYFNNAGRQMRVLGNSVRLRYLQLLGEKIEFPEDHYQGGYISEIAQKLFDEKGESLRDEPAEGIFKQQAEAAIFNDIKETLGRINIEFQNFYNEQSLYEDGRIDNLLSAFEKENLSYKKDDALWMKFSEIGQEQDKVIIKSTGEPTYRLPDIAYHITKFERGYDLIVDLFGSDHAATYPDVLAALKALGNDTEKIRVLIHQFVTITQGGEVVKMSTRKANYITLDELIEEVGPDVVRYFFIMRNISSHLNFDISIAKKQSDENPVFYLQYAHARICSIIRTAQEHSVGYSTDNLQLLSTEPEQVLIAKLQKFCDEITTAAERFEPHRISNYLEELAAAFHKFYTECRIIGSEKDLAEARMALAQAVKIVLKNGLTILGLNAPEKM